MAALVALVAVLFADSIFRGRVFYERDLGLLWYAQTESFVRAVLGGSFPLWNPYVAFGQPMLANANYQVLYPLTWLNLMMRPETFFVLFAVVHTMAAAGGQYRLARHLELSRGGAFVAAAVFVASGPFLSLLNTWNHFAAAALIPWALLAARKGLAEPGWRRSLLWGLPLGLQVLAGSPDLVVFTGVLVAAATLSAFDWRSPWSPASRRLLRAAAIALAFALAISAGQWLPSVEALRHSRRRDVPAPMAAGGSLHPVVGTAKLFSPLALAELPIRKEHAGPLLDGGMVLLRLPYLGLAATGLVLAGLIAPPRPGRTFLALAGAAAFLYALGPHGLIHPLATAAMPLLRGLRYPSKTLIIVALAWGLLGGMGFEYWRSAAQDARRRWLVVVSAPLLGLALLAAAGSYEMRSFRLLAGYLAAEDPRLPWRDALREPATRLAVAGVLASAMALLGWWRGIRSGHARFGATTAAAIALADLVIATRGVNRTTDRSFYRLRPALVEEVSPADFARVFVYRYEASRPLGSVDTPYKIAWYPAGLDFEAGQILGARLYPMPSVAGAWGLFGSYDPDLVELYPDHLTDIVRWAYEAHGTPAFRRYLELGAVRHAVGLDPRGFEDLEPLKELRTPLFLPARLYRVGAARPRTYVAASARIVDAAHARAWLEGSQFDPRSEVLLLQSDRLEAPRPGPAATGASHISVFKADYVRLEAELAQPGYVVLVDTWDPAWTARVDGRPAAILRANVAFRAVAVPAGRHVVEMWYRPRRVIVGLAVSVLAGALLIVAQVRARGRPGA